MFEIIVMEIKIEITDDERQAFLEIIADEKEMSKELTVDEWTNYYDPGEKCTTSHAWSEDGNYVIRVKAIDTDKIESEWSDPLVVSMPKNKVINPFLLFLERLIERFPILEQILQPIYDKLARC